MKRRTRIHYSDAQKAEMWDCPTCGKTLDANHAQLLAGMAWWYRYYAREQSPEDRGGYESAEDEAKARKWGLWADPNPINPYEWPKSRK